MEGSKSRDALATLVREGLNVAQLTYKRFELAVTQGPDAGLRQEFGQAVVQVGTARTNDLVLTDRTVSRFHLRIETNAGRFTLLDSGSTNGTYLGGYRIEVAHLTSEARVTVGGTELRLRPLADATTVTLPELDRLGLLVGGSSKMRQLYSVIERVAVSDIPVIIEGETGSGKDLVARMLHESSPRHRAPFEVLDCTAVPDNLLESELFGHERGAFTGAAERRLGVFERANGGTVFIDELGEIKLELQPKLLRVLETGKLRRLGGDALIPIDVRVVAATNRSMRNRVNEGHFREDLYYRLAGCTLELPPLRERTEDIPLLVEHFLALLRQAGRRDIPPHLDPETMQDFMAYHWPGNVRQLRSAVARATVMGGRAALQDEKPASAQANLEADDLALPLKEAKDEFERRYLVRLLARHHGDLKAAAIDADLHPKSLARLLRRYALGKP